MQYKFLAFEKKDIDLGKRTATIAHAAYNNIDRVGDISRKGMFNKSWQENKSDIAFYFNHNPEMAPGIVTNVFEDEAKAYTEVKLGSHTLGNDVLLMMDEGVAKWASFGYRTIKSGNITVSGKQVRELKEVKHIETSILTVPPANPSAGLISVQKMFGSADIEEIKAYLEDVDKFCRNTTATDECIKSLLLGSENIKAVLSKYDTANTPLATEPVASVEEEKQFDTNEAYTRLKLLNLKLN